MVKRLLKHFAAIAGGQVINLLGTVLLVPIFLAHWSTVAYGEWLALSSFANYLGTLDLGMNSAVSNRMLDAHVRGDVAEYRRCQHSAALFYTALALGFTVLVGLGAWLLPIQAWLGLKLTTHGDAAWVVWLLALQVLWMMPVGLLGNVYRTLGDPAKTQWINNIKYAASLIIGAIAVTLGCSMRVLAGLGLALVLLMASYVVWDLRRRDPALLPRFSGANLATMKELLKPSLLFAAIMVAMAITQQGSVLMVSAALGGAAVAVFVTTRTLTNLVMQVVSMVKNAAWPDLTILYASEDWEKLRATNRLLIALSGALCIGIGAALWYEGPELLTVWTHHKLHVDLTFFRLMLLYLILQFPWLTSSAITVAVNRHQGLSKSYLVSAIIGIVAIALLVPRVGLLGVPIGLILGEAVACYHFVVKDTCAVVREPYGPFAARFWLGGAAILSLSLAAGWVAHAVMVGPSLLRWAEVGMVTLSTASALAWWVWLRASDREQLRGRVSRFYAAKRRAALTQPSQA